MFSGEGAHTVTLTAQKQGLPVNFTRSVDFTLRDPLGWAVPKLWAREKIAQLQLAQGTTTANKAAIIKISEDYEVLSEYTAFLASDAQVATPANSIAINAPTGLREAPLTLQYFDLTQRGSLLFLDWKAPVEVESIRIYDLHGRILFTYRPGPHAIAIGRWVWDGRGADGLRLGRGRYVISVQTRSGLRNQVFVWNPGR
jgi:hypothetical protein